MATLYGTQANKVINSPITVIPPGFKSEVMCITDIFVGNVIAQNDVVMMGSPLPKGAIPLFYILQSSVTFGATATIAIGTAASAAKYRAAAVLNQTTPEISSISTLGVTPLTGDEQLQLTVAAAAGPSSGNTLLKMFYVVA